MPFNFPTFFRLLVCLHFLFLFSPLGYGQVVINEIAPNNNYYLADETGDFPDWIELYNSGNTTVDLSGYFFSDNLLNLKRWTFPNNVIIEPDSFLLIYASGKTPEEAMQLENLHCGFRLSKTEPEILTLSNAEELPVDQISYPILADNHSYGRLTDGAMEWGIFEQVSPGLPNFTFPKDNAFNPTISFSKEAGFYSAAFELSLQFEAETTADIYYTLDGNLPNEQAKLYTTPILIDETSVVCARSIKTDGQGSFVSLEVECKTYFINETHELPIFSIITAPDNLFSDERGIYVKGLNADWNFPYWGANFWRDSKVPVFVEYFEQAEEGTSPNLNQEAELTIHGGRSSRNQPMRSLRLIAKDNEVFNHTFFEDKETIDSFKRLVLRNSGSDFNRLHFRDAIVHQLLNKESNGINTDVDVLAYRPVIVYLNGDYWGIYNLREKADQYYIASNYLEPVDSLDVLEEDTFVITGNFDHFNEMLDFFDTNDLSIDSNYLTASNHLDIPSFIDYLSTEFILNNIDWPNNNIKYWRSQQGGKWRYLLFDLDVCLNGNPFAPVELDLLGLLLGPNNADVSHIHLFKSLLNNQAFRYGFINRAADFLNSIFEPTYFSQAILEQKRLLSTEMDRHFAKWPTSNHENWQAETDSTISFIEQRPAFVRQQITDHLNAGNEYELNLTVVPYNTGNIQVNSIRANDFPWQGFYFDEVPITLTAEPIEGFEFDHWLIDGQEPIFEPTLSATWSNSVAIEAIFTQKPDHIFPTRLTSNLLYKGTPVVLNFLLEENETLVVNLININGQLIEQRKESFLHGLYELDFATNHLPSGQYFIQLVTDKEILATLPFVLVD